MKAAGSSKKTLLKAGLGLAAVFMLAMVLVPLYQHFTAGHDHHAHNGHEAGEAVVEINADGSKIDRTRAVRLNFAATNEQQVPVEFSAKLAYVELNPGDIQTHYYKVKNLTGNNIVIQAVPQTTPLIASSYLRKVECFCFSAQPLTPGEEAELFVNLYVHEALPAEVDEMTLSYSLLDLTDQVSFEDVIQRDATGRGTPDPNRVSSGNGGSHGDHGGGHGDHGGDH